MIHISSQLLSKYLYQFSLVYWRISEESQELVHSSVWAHLKLNSNINNKILLGEKCTLCFSKEENSQACSTFPFPWWHSLIHWSSRFLCILIRALCTHQWQCQSTKQQINRNVFILRNAKKLISYLLL